MIKIYKNSNYKKNAHNEFNRTKIISKIQFQNFYMKFRRLNFIVEHNESYFMYELKKRIISRMRKILSNIFLFEHTIFILNIFVKYLNNLNARQRWFIIFKIFNKVENVVLFFKLINIVLFNAVHITSTITTITIKSIFKIIRENTSTSFS